MVDITAITSREVARTLLAIIIVAMELSMIDAIPIDNGVEGEPEVECGAEGIEVTFHTRRPFNGRLYVKGRHSDGGCQNELIGRSFTGITLSFGTCNVQRLRSLNPKGIFASATVVISFHPFFVTKVDRVYRVQCFYMEAEKSVRQQVAVSDINADVVTHLVPMPVCRYEVLDGGPMGAPIQFAVVGQQVYHKWTCDSELPDTFCMIVHSCMVDDGRNNNEMVTMINQDGCALDRFVLTNLEYPTDLIAGQEAHIFKYADRSLLFFQCKISITIKESGAECPRPKCPEPTGRGKRHIHQVERNMSLDEAQFIVDVSSQQIDTLDLTSLGYYMTAVGSQGRQTLWLKEQEPRLSCLRMYNLTLLASASYLLVMISLVLSIRWRKYSDFN